MALTKCEDCGQMISVRATTCPHCGAPIEKKVVCEECGEKILASSSHCPSCGCPNPHYNVGIEQTADMNTMTQRVVLVGTNYCNKGVSGKSRFKFSFLAFSFGGIGVHYFYCGKNGAGVINILCCTIGLFLVIPTILIIFFTMYTLIKALLMTQEEFEQYYVYSDKTYPI